MERNKPFFVKRGKSYLGEKIDEMKGEKLFKPEMAKNKERGPSQLIDSIRIR